MSEENDNTSSGCFNALGFIFIIFLVYLFFGSIWPRLFPNIKMMGDEHDLFASESPIIEQPSVKTKLLNENTIKQHLIGKKLRNAEWTFVSLDEFEHFEIESVSTDENQDKTYIIKSVLKDWKADKRYNSRFFIKYDKIQGQSELADFVWRKEMILDVAAYSFELIVPEKDLSSENDNTSVRKIICPNCDGTGREILPCFRCNYNINCERQGSGGYTQASQHANGIWSCRPCSDCKGRGVFPQRCGPCSGTGRVNEFE